VLFDSNVKHSLFTSAYNQRREECEQGLAILSSHFPEVKSFREASEEQLLSIKDFMTEDVFKRSHYVIKEIKRVTLACEALDNGDIVTLGQLLFETHEGLSKEYEVSCPELDMIVDTLKKEPAVIGSRMMGGGFGGCTINLIKKGEEDAIKTKLTQLYQAAFGIELKTYEVRISNGTSLYNPV
jgi:galactokinase